VRRAPVIPRDENRLSHPQRARLVCEVLLTYCRVRWAIRRNDLPDALSQLRLEPILAPKRPEPRAAAYLASRRMAYVVVSVLRLLPTDSRCLMRSLVVTRLLSRRGLESSLIIGVTPDPGFAAHAWVEYDGKPVLPTYGAATSRLVEL
jgi:hypothetical protein